MSSSHQTHRRQQLQHQSLGPDGKRERVCAMENRSSSSAGSGIGSRTGAALDRITASWVSMLSAFPIAHAHRPHAHPVNTPTYNNTHSTDAQRKDHVVGHHTLTGIRAVEVQKAGLSPVSLSLSCLFPVRRLSVCRLMANTGCLALRLSVCLCLSSSLQMMMLLPMKMMKVTMRMLIQMKHTKDSASAEPAPLWSSPSVCVTEKDTATRRGHSGPSGRQYEAVYRALICLLDGFLSLTVRQTDPLLPQKGDWVVVVMGTALSLSPAKKPEKLALQEPHESRDEDEEVEKNKEQEEQDKKKRKRHPVLLHVLGWKKRLAAARAKRKGVKRGDVQCDPPNQTVHRAPKATHQSRQVLVPGPVPDQRSIISPRRVVVQASTGELLRCLSDFLCRRCIKLKELTSNQIILWFRNVDGALLFQGWQDQCFISPASLVFVYLLGREAVNEDTSSEQELHATFLTCLYLAYSYLGNEISYPLKPFLVESSRDAFWDRALVLIDRLSADMLRINADPHFFAEVFQDLKKQGGSRQKKKDGEKRDRERQGKSQKIKVKQEKENDGGKPFDGLDR